MDKLDQPTLHPLGVQIQWLPYQRICTSTDTRSVSLTLKRSPQRKFPNFRNWKDLNLAPENCIELVRGRFIMVILPELLDVIPTDPLASFATRGTLSNSRDWTGFASRKAIIPAGEMFAKTFSSRSA